MPASYCDNAGMRRIIAVVLVAGPLTMSATLTLRAVDRSRRSGDVVEADDRDALLQAIESRRAFYADITKQIWAFAEVGYQEQKSSALLQQQLRAAGFSVR